MKRLNRKQLFAVGEWNGLPFTATDLDGIVNSFYALGLTGRVPLKLGHEGPDPREAMEREPHRQFSMGWVQSIYRDGDTLYGDLEVPDKVAPIIDEQWLKFVSIELLRNVKAGTRSIPWVLDAVALLGADQPAVGILQSLQTLTMSRRRSFERDACVAFRIAGNATTQSSKESKMDDAEKKRLEKLEADIAKFQTDLTAANQRASTAESNLAKEKAANRRATIVARFTTAIEKEQILPRSQEKFAKLYGLEDDAKVVNISDDDVKTFIDERAEVDKAEITKTKKGGAGKSGEDDKEKFAGKKNVEVFTTKVDQKMAASKPRDGEAPWQFRQRCTEEVMREDPNLARAYLDRRDEEYQAA